METLCLPMDCLWEGSLDASLNAFIEEQPDDIFNLSDATEYDQLYDDTESIRSLESTDDKWPICQPLSPSENTYGAPFFYINTGLDLGTVEDINQPKQESFISLETSLYPSEAAVPCVDVARELQVVDELVRLHAQSLPNEWVDDESSLASSSTASSSPRSETSFTSSYSSTSDLQRTSTKKTSSKSEQKLSRARSYEDKKYRKKEQNKNAANRYRQKKKAAIGFILEEEKDLEKKNSDLNEKLTDVKREKTYLKRLMRDLYRAKGVLV